MGERAIARARKGQHYGTEASRAEKLFVIASFSFPFLSSREKSRQVSRGLHSLSLSRPIQRNSYVHERASGRKKIKQVQTLQSFVSRFLWN